LILPVSRPRKVAAASAVPPSYRVSVTTASTPACLRLAPIICNDINYTAAARIPARMGAQLVMVPTRMFAGVWNEMQVMAVFRAVENRISIVMADGAYRTTLVDPFGRIVADQVTPAGGPLTLVADVPIGNPNALYTRLGDWVGWLSLAGWIGSMVLQSTTARRQKKARETALAAG
jgi:apolipoprotein N-acyltransferase